VDKGALDRLRVACYRLDIRAETGLCLPPYKGSTFRGGFGGIFKRIACAMPGQCRERCRIGAACPYGYIFETSPPPGAQQLRNLSDIPRPFVLEPPETRQEAFGPGEGMALGLVLVGRGIDYLPYFILTFRALGEEGIGRGRGRFRLERVAAQHPLTGAEAEVYSGADGMVRACDLAVTGEELTEAGQGIGEEATVAFLTPTRLTGEERLQDKPEFHLLCRAALRRISSLMTFHCGANLEVDYRAEIEAARGVTLAEDRTRWEDRERYSSRQGERMKLGGIVGEARYRGDLGRFGAMLKAAEVVHVGKNTTFGLGRIRVKA